MISEISFPSSRKASNNPNKRSKMSFLSNNKADIWYTVEGQGPIVLLLHGVACDSHDWMFQIPMLVEYGFRVIALDHRGHGRSSAPLGSYAPEVLADDAAALLKHLDLENVIVFAHSMGCTVAGALVVRHPNSVRALVLADPAPALPRTGSMLGQLVASMGSEDSPARIGAYFAARLYSPDTPAGMKTWHRRRALGTPAHVVTGCIHGMYGHEKALGRKEVAEEYLKDRFVPRLAVFRAEEITADERRLPLGEFGEIVVLGDAGHWAHQQKSEEFNEIVVGWLKKVGLLLERKAA
jgi:pimeloyl-ACP methyl ester carboxylesterase